MMEAMKLSPEIIDGSFRVSLCKDTTEDEINALLDAIGTVLAWKQGR